jgi:hypothetical protein
MNYFDAIQQSKANIDHVNRAYNKLGRDGYNKAMFLADRAFKEAYNNERSEHKKMNCGIRAGNLILTNLMRDN